MEIGAGCGAITRYLGETGAQVTALEGSLRRAHITAERCRDLPNVEVVAGNFDTFPEGGGYDWVIAIGVLEYANLFINREQAAEHLLTKVRRSLSPSGRLVVAIENQFGLKYWAGASEDHVGRPFFGVENRYSEATATTYGRIHLESLLRAAGFAHQELLLPYPDYKLPTTIIRAAALSGKDLSVPSLLHGLLARDYGTEWYSFVDEHRIYGLLQRNGLVSDLANSFLVIASPDGDPREATASGDVWIYSVGKRLTRFAKEVTISGGRSSTREVQVGRIGESAECAFEMNAGLRGVQWLESGSYGSGDTEAVIVYQSFATESAAAIAGAFQRWAEFVFERAKPGPVSSASALGGWVVDGALLDLIPKNVIFSTSSDPHVFDLEWRIDGDIPLGWLLFRGVEQCRRFQDPREVMLELCRLLGLQMAEEDFLCAEELEQDFQSSVTVPTTYEKAPPTDLAQLEFRLLTAESEAKRAVDELDAIMRRRIVRAGLSFARRVRPLFTFRRSWLRAR